MKSELILTAHYNLLYPLGVYPEKIDSNEKFQKLIKKRVLLSVLKDLTLYHSLHESLSFVPNHMYRLVRLDISRTSISSIPDDMVSLKKLRISFCEEIEEIPPGVLQQLEAIDASHASKFNIPERDNHGIIAYKKMKYMDVTGTKCSFSGIRKSFPKILSYKSNDLQINPMHANCWIL